MLTGVSSACTLLMSLLLEIVVNESSCMLLTAQDDISDISMTARTNLVVSSFATGGEPNASVSVTALLDGVALETIENFTLSIEIVENTFPDGILEGSGSFTVGTLEVSIRDAESK